MKRPSHSLIIAGFFLVSIFAIIFLGGCGQGQNVPTGTSTSTTSSTTTTIVIPAPIISPASGTYEVYPTVTITSEIIGASIYYTIDGGDPTTASYLYAGPFSIQSTHTVRAVVATSGATSLPSRSDFSVWSVKNLSGIATPSQVCFGADDTLYAANGLCNRYDGTTWQTETLSGSVITLSLVRGGTSLFALVEKRSGNYDIEKQNGINSWGSLNLPTLTTKPCLAASAEGIPYIIGNYTGEGGWVLKKWNSDLLSWETQSQAVPDAPNSVVALCVAADGNIYIDSDEGYGSYQILKLAGDGSWQPVGGNRYSYRGLITGPNGELYSVEEDAVYHWNGVGWSSLGGNFLLLYSAVVSVDGKIIADGKDSVTGEYIFKELDNGNWQTYSSEIAGSTNGSASDSHGNIAVTLNMQDTSYVQYLSLDRLPIVYLRKSN